MATIVNYVKKKLQTIFITLYGINEFLQQNLLEYVSYIRVKYKNFSEM